MSQSKLETPSRIGLTSDQLRSPLVAPEGEPGESRDFSLNASSIQSPRGESRDHGTRDFPPPETIEERPNEENHEGDKGGPIVKIDPADDIPNNTNKCIDFNAQLQAHKKRTEAELPYTLT